MSLHIKPLQRFNIHFADVHPKLVMLLENLALCSYILDQIPAPVHKVHQFVGHHFHISHLYYLSSERLLLVKSGELFMNLRYQIPCLNYVVDGGKIYFCILLLDFYLLFGDHSLEFWDDWVFFRNR